VQFFSEANRDFFKGTPVESAAEKLLTASAR
jgi:hypothetical protein